MQGDTAKTGLDMEKERQALVQSEIVDRAVYVTLNRPDRLNSLTTPLLSQLLDTLKDVNKRPDLSCLVVQGNGRGFCAGMDREFYESTLHEPTSSTMHEMVDFLRIGGEVFSQILAFEGLTVSCVSGFVIGGGLLLSSACDIRVVEENCKMSLPERDYGLPVAWGALGRLVDIVGESRVLDWVVTGRNILDAEAYDAGLTTRLVGVGDSGDVAAEYAAAAAGHHEILRGFTKPRVRAHARQDDRLSTLEAMGAFEFVLRHREMP